MEPKCYDRLKGQPAIETGANSGIGKAVAAIKEFKRKGIDEHISNSAGKIICMSSVHDVIPWAGHANYAASKGGIMLLMKSMALPFMLMEA